MSDQQYVNEWRPMARPVIAEWHDREFFIDRPNKRQERKTVNKPNYAQEVAELKAQIARQDRQIAELKAEIARQEDQQWREKLVANSRQIAIEAGAIDGSR